MDFAGLDELSVLAFASSKVVQCKETTEGGAQIILAVYRAPQRPSDAAMCGFSRRISQSGKFPLPPSFCKQSLMTLPPLLIEF
jgi:hypothetical protein